MAKKPARPGTGKVGHAAIARICLALPGATKNVQWGNDLVFKVGGKMFAAMGANPGEPTGLSFRASDDSFEILTRLRGIIPAPYLARAKWVRLDHLAVLPECEIRAYLARSHALVAAGLTKKRRAELGISGDAGATTGPPRVKPDAKSPATAEFRKRGRRK